MKNDIKKTQDFFRRFTKEEIRKLKILADIIHDKIEANFGPDAILNEELENIDPARKKMLFITPDEIKHKGLYTDEAERLLQSIGNEFGFGNAFFAEGLDHYFFYVSDRTIFYYFYKQLSKVVDKTTENNAGNLIRIYYQKEAGIGTVDGKDFKLHTEPKCKVFGELYDNLNTRVLRQKVLELAGFNKGYVEITNTVLKDNPKKKSSTHTSETYFIKDLVKEMRKNTGLSPKQLVNNNGNLTLIGKRAKSK